MSRHHFTLAALATSAVPGLEVAVARPFTGGGSGEHDAALITAVDGRHAVVRTPATPRAEDRLLAEVRALAALTAGARSRLPFGVPTVYGTGAHPTTVVTSYVPGSRLRPEAVQAGGRLAASIAAAVAAVHALPTGLVADAGLPVQSASDAQRAVAEVVDAAAATASVPRALLDRWEQALDDATLWQFTSTVLHGSLRPETVLTAPRGTPDEAVSGLLDWSELRVGDPARDLAWALGLPGTGAASGLFAAYHAIRRGAADPSLRQRAMLHAELELARWLLHGRATGRQEIVTDALGMLAGLARGVEADTAGSLGPEPMPVLTLDEVERMLDDQRSMMLARTGPVPLPATVAQRARSSSAE
ncbi:MAG TPA: phosphotransferase [Amnibacterium sp.]|jgi:aminoglycoside phosphotransferase (APT) family kinase protein|uniref:phosphotransferase n=1 Tax=Amnibacterium sp. TaxID=1872496 RepID=UPI002F94A3CA